MLVYDADWHTQAIIFTDSHCENIPVLKRKQLGVVSVEPDKYIAGWKTAEWDAIRVRLSQSEAGVWHEAFTEFFKSRLELRYLKPIKILQDNDKLQGEGFSIVAIQCSLIEFLESTAQGKNYRHWQRDVILGTNEYSSSQTMFVDFLRNRAPFSNTFDSASAQDFYVSVRCGLLHEAQTKNGWRIKANCPAGVVANVKDRIVYRNNFQSALLKYVEAYGADLQVNTDLQQAFIRKFENVCA